MIDGCRGSGLPTKPTTNTPAIRPLPCRFTNRAPVLDKFGEPPGLFRQGSTRRSPIYRGGTNPPRSELAPCVRRKRARSGASIVAEPGKRLVDGRRAAPWAAADPLYPPKHVFFANRTRASKKMKNAPPRLRAGWFSESRTGLFQTPWGRKRHPRGTYTQVKNPARFLLAALFFVVPQPKFANGENKQRVSLPLPLVRAPCLPW